MYIKVSFFKLLTAILMIGQMSYFEAWVNVFMASYPALTGRA